MNKKIKAKFLAALTSGKYKQAFYTTHEGDCYYCALGLLSLVGTGVANNTTKCVNYAEKIGVSTEWCNRLIYYNDDKRYSFKKIAGFVKRYL